MKAFLAIGTLLVWMSFLSQAAEGSLKVGVPRKDLPLTLDVSSAGFASFALERSSDFRNWRPVLNLYLRGTNASVVDASITSKPLVPLFYRASAPAPDGIELAKRFRSLGYSHYQFNFSRSCFCVPSFRVAGTVVVKDGKVVAVQNAVADGRPVANPDFSMFKTMEELFDVISQAVADRADLITVHLAPANGFPERIYIDYILRAVDDEISYGATDLQRLP